jgi:hypothetical protein
MQLCCRVRRALRVISISTAAARHRHVEQMIASKRGESIAVPVLVKHASGRGALVWGARSIGTGARSSASHVPPSCKVCDPMSADMFHASGESGLIACTQCE